MAEHIYLLTILLPLGAITLIFGMKYFSAAQRARAEVASADASRELADKVVSAQSAHAASLAAFQNEFTDVKARLAAVEKILKTVE